MVKASITNLRQSPRKVRRIADLVRGRSVSFALITLNTVSKRAAAPLKKLIESAVANAKNLNLSSELVIKKITVDGGPILYRRRPRARGASAPIRKRTSHIEVVLAEAEAKPVRGKKKAAEKKK